MGGDYRIGDWIVSPLRRTIERGDEVVHVKPKSMSVLECLVAAQGEPVTRHALLDSVWPGAEVSDDVLTKCIVELRRAFGDSARESRVIETIPKMGFRLLLPAKPLVRATEDELASSPPSGRRQWLRPLGILLAALVLLVGVLLSISPSRAWLTETGINLFLRTASFLSPHQLAQKPGIAVLPLVNFSGDPENEYFSDGLSAEIINRLARADRLPVIARSSSFEFKERFQDVREIGRMLGVSHVLEGSVRKAGENIRLTVQLIDTVEGTHVWSGFYQRELSDIFKLQDEIAQDIVYQVTNALGDSALPQPKGEPAVAFIGAQPLPNLEAYELYLKGVQMVTSNRPLLIAQATDYFDGAIALEPEYADAWAGKGYALGFLGLVESGSTRIPAEVYPGAIAAFRKALEIDPAHAFATGWLGVTLMLNDFKWTEGMRLLERSLELNPNNADLLAVYGFYLENMQLPGAAEVLERAYRLDPFSLQAILVRAIHLARQGRYLDAASLVETSLIQDREGYGPNYFSAYFNIQLGRLDEAEERLRKARLVAHPVDLNLEALKWLIDSRRGKDSMLPMSRLWERMQTEHMHGALHATRWNAWGDEATTVAIFDLAIEQRHPALRTVIFGPKPDLMPEADWRRIQEITGVTRYRQSR